MLYSVLRPPDYPMSTRKSLAPLFHIADLIFTKKDLLCTMPLPLSRPQLLMPLVQAGSPRFPLLLRTSTKQDRPFSQYAPFSFFFPPNKVYSILVLEMFPALYQERKDTIEAEERNSRLDTPIFVCQLSFPGMPTLLHFFEPRHVYF